MSEGVTTYRVPAKPVIDAYVRPPGSKSITNRALVAAALAPGRSYLDHFLHSDDTEAMVSCLRVLGVNIEYQENRLVVAGAMPLPGGGVLDARASGTTARFLTAAACLADHPSVLDGTRRLRQRPLGELFHALHSLGAQIASKTGGLPVHIAGGGIPGGEAEIDASRSSQFLSALMLAAPAADDQVTLRPSSVVVSKPYVKTTLEVMKAFGVEVSIGESAEYIVAPTGYQPQCFRVEADASAAVYPWAAAAITTGSVTVTGIQPDSTQADLAALDILEKMGCTVERGSEGIKVEGPMKLRGVDADLNHCPDAALALSVLLAFSDTGGSFTNLATLRIKETDRLAALEAEISKIGAQVKTGPDWIDVRPGTLRPAQIATYDDHRIAMSFAVAGLVLPGMVIEDPQCVSKTWPRFFEMLEEL